jgi:3-keto-disaccharide hydrolase
MKTLSCVLLALFAVPSPAAADDFKLEPGFKSFFNGKDLTGFKMRQGGASLDGKTATAKKRFQVVGGKLVVDFKSRGNMVIDTTKSFDGDVHIKFEFLAGKGCNNDLFFRGLKFDIKQGKGGVDNLKPGTWQTFEIVVKDQQAVFKCDGKVQRTQKAKTKSSPLGIRAEFGPIQYRRMRYK